MMCPACLGKRFVWVLVTLGFDDKGMVIEGPGPEIAQMEICYYCLGAGEVSCCDGPVSVTNEKEPDDAA